MKRHEWGKKIYLHFQSCDFMGLVFGICAGPLSNNSRTCSPNAVENDETEKDIKHKWQCGALWVDEI